MQPLSGNQRPDLRTSLVNMLLVPCLPGKLHVYGSSSNVPRLQTLLRMPQNPHVFSLLTRCIIPCACHAKRHLNVQKCHEPVSFFTLLTSKCASRHKGVHFFESMVCFVHFDLENVLRATTACTFSTSQLPKVVREWCVLCILISKCASCHNGVQLFISHLARWLRTRRFSEPTFRPSGATNHWKNAVFRDFATFSRTCIFFPLSLSLLWSSLFCSSLLWLCPPLLFHLSILSEVWLLNFWYTHTRTLYIPQFLVYEAHTHACNFICTYDSSVNIVHVWII